MQTILEELYHGNIRPDVKIYGEDSPFVQAARVKSKNLDKLLALLDETQKEVFEAYSDAQAEIDDITRYEKFTYGFRLGSLLMLEIMTDKEEMLK